LQQILASNIEYFIHGASPFMLMKSAD